MVVWKFITKLPALDLRAGPIDKGAAGYEKFLLQCHGNITEIINYPSRMMDVIGWWCPWQNILLNYLLLVPAYSHVPMIKYYSKWIWNEFIRREYLKILSNKRAD